MKRDKFLLKEEINRINELAGRSTVAGKHLVVIDIQPEYASGFSHFLNDFVRFLNNNYKKLSQLTFMFNGSNTVGSMDESEYRFWWMEAGLKESIADEAHFYDKGYAFFRYCMDSGIEEQETVNLVKFMIDKNVNDSRDLTEEFWDEFIDRFGNHNIRELMETAGDCISIPDLMDEIRRYNNIVLCGGGVNECLKEVEIALHALNKPYNVLTQYTY